MSIHRMTHFVVDVLSDTIEPTEFINLVLEKIPDIKMDSYGFTPSYRWKLRSKTPKGFDVEFICDLDKHVATTNQLLEILKNLVRTHTIKKFLMEVDLFDQIYTYHNLDEYRRSGRSKLLHYETIKVVC